jgi:hypothetical protein
MMKLLSNVAFNFNLRRYSKDGKPFEAQLKQAHVPVGNDG